MGPLLAEADGRGPLVRVRHLLQRSEPRRARLVAKLLDRDHPVLVAYSGVRAVGFRTLPTGEPFVSESWRGLGVDEELLAFPV